MLIFISGFVRLTRSINFMLWQGFSLEVVKIIPVTVTSRLFKVI